MNLANFQVHSHEKYHISAAFTEQRIAILRAGRTSYLKDCEESQTQNLSETEYFALMKKFAYAQPGRKWSREEMNER
ncbi:MAG: hypothetical protein R3E08_00380 [Thiotrichaceae bacterium]